MVVTDRNSKELFAAVGNNTCAGGGRLHDGYQKTKHMSGTHAKFYEVGFWCRANISERDAVRSHAFHVSHTLKYEHALYFIYIRRPRLKEGERARDYRCGNLALLRLSTNLQATDASTARCCSNTCITGAATYCASSSQHEPAGNRRGHCSMLLEHMHQWNRKLQQHTNPSGGGSQCRGRAP